MASQPADRAVDLLGDLPTDVLDKVLAGLPAREVVRTSVLSPPWRRRWESVRGLDVELFFHDDVVRVNDDEATVAAGGGSTSWWCSVARFLERCAGPVGRVSIHGVPLSACHRADGWVRAAAGKSPRALSVALPLAAPLPSLFRCDPAALAELHLRRCAIPAPPPAGFAGFDRLAKLDLDGVVFTGVHGWAQLEAMVSAAAPTLVELRLVDIAFRVAGGGGAALPAGRWVIQAPKLRRLELCLRIAGASLWELAPPLPNLELARIFLNDSPEDRDYVQMFTAIFNVGELHIGNFDITTQAAAINIFQDLLWRFENLRILRLDANFYEFPTNHLFNLFPFLQTVEIKRWYGSTPLSSGLHILSGYV